MADNGQVFYAIKTTSANGKIYRKGDPISGVDGKNALKLQMMGYITEDVRHPAVRYYRAERGLPEKATKNEIANAGEPRW